MELVQIIQVILSPTVTNCRQNGPHAETRGERDTLYLGASVRENPNEKRSLILKVKKPHRGLTRGMPGGCLRTATSAAALAGAEEQPTRGAGRLGERKHRAVSVRAVGSCLCREASSWYRYHSAGCEREETT